MRGLLAPLIKLIVFLLTTMVATYLLAVTISNKSFGSQKTYKALFKNSAGLQQGDDVRVAGVRVGTIKNIKIANQNQAEVTFSVAVARSVPKSSLLKIKYRNLVGQRYLSIEQGPGDPNDLVGPKDVIPITQTTPSLDLTDLFAGFAPLFKGLDASEINKLSFEIVQSLQGEGGAVESLFSHLASLTQALADKDQVIGDLVTNLSSVLVTIGQRDQELSALLTNLQQFVSGLSQDRKTIGDAIDGINQLSVVTAGLLTDVRPPLKQDIVDLTNEARILNASSGTIDKTLQGLPNKFAALVRTSSYGTWFNFFMCDIGGTVTVGPIKLPVNQKVNAPRCQG